MRSTFGELKIIFTKGWCPVDEVWVVPLRDAWNLSNKRHLSPSLERKLCSTAVETGSFDKAARLAAEWGCSISDNTIQRSVSRLAEQTEVQPLSKPCADRAGPEDTLIIMMDGWMARHRGRGWGFTKPCEGWDAVNWYEIKTAVIYRFKDQVELSPKRTALLHKHVVTTPAKTDPLSFGKRIHHEAMRMGMAQWNHSAPSFKIDSSGAASFGAYLVSRHFSKSLSDTKITSYVLSGRHDMHQL